MKVTINYGGQLVSVEVSVEVYEFLDCADHKEENLAHEKRRHWDGREFETQRRRFLLYALDGMSYAEIADLYGCSKASIFESIEAVRKKVKKYWMRCPDE